MNIEERGCEAAIQACGRKADSFSGSENLIVELRLRCQTRWDALQESLEASITKGAVSIESLPLM